MSSMCRTIRRNAARIADNGETKRYYKRMHKEWQEEQRKQYEADKKAKQAKKAGKAPEKPTGLKARIRSMLKPNKVQREVKAV